MARSAPASHRLADSHDFTFVVDGPAAAIAQARKAADARDVFVMGGGALVGSCLRDGLLDELRLHVSPEVLGAGTPLFAGVGRHRLVQTAVAVCGLHPSDLPSRPRVTARHQPSGSGRGRESTARPTVAPMIASSPAPSLSSGPSRPLLAALTVRCRCWYPMAQSTTRASDLARINWPLLVPNSDCGPSSMTYPATMPESPTATTQTRAAVLNRRTARPSWSGNGRRCTIRVKSPPTQIAAATMCTPSEIVAIAGELWWLEWPVSAAGRRAAAAATISNAEVVALEVRAANIATSRATQNVAISARTLVVSAQ